MYSFIWDFSIAFFNTITSFITASYFFSIFSERKRKYNPVTYLVYLIFLITLLLVKNSYLNMAILIVCIFILSFNYRMKVYNKILFTLVFIALNVVSEEVAFLTLMNVFSLGFESAESGVFSAFGAILSKFFFFIIAYIIGSAKNQSLMGKFRKRWLGLYVLPIGTFFLTYALYQSMHYCDNNVFIKDLSLISTIMLIISNMLIFKLVNDIHDSIVNENKLALAEELIKQQEKQYRLLFENNETVIKLRHDYKNFIILLSE